MSSDNPFIASMLLAAGSSSRMGHPKQLIPYQGSTLIQRVVNELRSVPAIRYSLIITGAVPASRLDIADDDHEILHFRDWPKGMGASIKFGLKYLLKKQPVPGGCLILPVDQPLVRGPHLERIIEAWQGEESIAAAYYRDQPGTPALFGKAYFDQLLRIGDQKGAQTILRDPLNQVVRVDLPEAAIDIDTPKDLKYLE